MAAMKTKQQNSLSLENVLLLCACTTEPCIEKFFSAKHVQISTRN
jgi:hypothetical protein